MEEKQFNQELLDHTAYLRAFARKLTNNAEQAEDLFQETVYRALSNREKFHYGHIKWWLTTIMKNLFINQVRKMNKYKIVNSGDDGEFLIDTYSSPATNAGDSKIMLKEMEAEISKLHPDLKTAFLMRYQGFKYEEIANQVGIPLGTVKTRIHFARKHLMHKLNALYGTTSLSELAA